MLSAAPRRRSQKRRPKIAPDDAPRHKRDRDEATNCRHLNCRTACRSRISQLPRPSRDAQASQWLRPTPMVGAPDPPRRRQHIGM